MRWKGGLASAIAWSLRAYPFAFCMPPLVGERHVRPFVRFSSCSLCLRSLVEQLMALGGSEETAEMRKKRN